MPATGNGVSLPVSGLAVWSINVTTSGSATATLVPQVSADGGTTWRTVTCTQSDTGQEVTSLVVATTPTANANWRCNVTGYTLVRPVATATNATGTYTVIGSANAYGNALSPLGTVSMNCVAGCSGATVTVATITIGSVNATITNTPSVFATITNAASITVSVGSVTATITNTPSVLATIGNTSIPVTQSGNWLLATGSGTIGTVLQGNAPWSMTQSGNWTIATITNTVNVNCTGCSAAAAVTATITNTPSVFATIGNTSIPVTQSGNWTIATLTNTASVSIVSCAAGICATPGQASMASSTSVVIANNQTAFPVTVATTAATPMITTRLTLPTAAADGAGMAAMGDKFGRLVVTQQGDRSLATRAQVTIATTTETTLLAAGGSGIFWDLTHLSCSNTSAATATRVDIRDTTAGTVRYSFQLAGNGGGFVAPFIMPFPQSTSNANWTAQLSVNVTDVRCQILAVQNK